MEIIKLNNHFLYWVDRFDHILSPEEFKEIPFISFAHIQDLSANSELTLTYLKEEKKLTQFAIHIIKKFGPHLENTKGRYSYLSTFSDHLLPLFNDRQIKMFHEVEEYEPEIAIKSLDDFVDLIQMGIRESLKVRFNINNIYLEAGFDMSLIIQNLVEEELLALCKMSNLHALRKWEHSMWG